MANSEKGEVSFEVEGKTYKLRYSTNALCEMEDAAGVGAVEFANSLSDEKKVRIKDLRTMFWAGLFDNHKITIEEAGSLLDVVGLEFVGSLCGEAFTLAFPVAEEGEPSEGKQKAAT